jgi:hypothetical protein
MMMNDKEAIEACRAGKRVQAQFSMYASEKPDGCPGWNHDWRVIACDNETDVVECRRCGKQELARCNFDDDYA